MGSTGGGRGGSGNLMCSGSSLYTTPKNASEVVQTIGAGISLQEPPGKFAPVVVLALILDSFFNLIRS